VRSSETQRGLEREAEYARERLVPARQALTPARLRECRLERARVVAIGYQHEVGRARSKTQAGDDVVTSAREAEIEHDHLRMYEVAQVPGLRRIPRERGADPVGREQASECEQRGRVAAARYDAGAPPMTPADEAPHSLGGSQRRGDCDRTKRDGVLGTGDGEARPDRDWGAGKPVQDVEPAGPILWGFKPINSLLP